MTTQIITFLVAVAFMILLFFALRGLILWYYKINTIVELLTEIKEELRKR